MWAERRICGREFAATLRRARCTTSSARPRCLRLPAEMMTGSRSARDGYANQVKEHLISGVPNFRPPGVPFRPRCRDVRKAEGRSGRRSLRRLGRGLRRLGRGGRIGNGVVAKSADRCTPKTRVRLVGRLVSGPWGAAGGDDRRDGRQVGTERSQLHRASVRETRKVVKFLPFASLTNCRCQLRGRESPFKQQVPGPPWLGCQAFNKRSFMRAQCRDRFAF